MIPEQSKGSEWRIWDLHIHTPNTAKNDQFGGSDSWDRYISKLEKTDIAVFGITDYFSIDNYLRLKQEQERGRLVGKTLIPNVELRIIPVTKNTTPINIHVLFDPTMSSEVIEREFFRNLNFTYRGNRYACIRTDLISLGRAYKNDEKLNEDVAKKEGIGQFVVNFDELRAIVQKPSLRNSLVVVLSNSSRDGNSGIQHSSLAATRQEIYRMSDIIFSGNQSDISYFLGKGGKDRPQDIISNYGSLKPCITGSDAHAMNQIGVFTEDRKTWIKADTTFEGLKQIIYEPECRVKVQKDNPSYEIEKHPFTQVYIPKKTQVFSDDEDVFFDPVRLPLNSNLVSIIGGRGTGKSVLINYIAAAFRKHNHSSCYNLNSEVVISRQTSLTEEAREFKVSESPNVPFMYIAQSQIKELVQDKVKFSQNIRETIGVTEDYSVSKEYQSLADSAVNEYFRIAKIINSDDLTSDQAKKRINDDIKRNKDFIENITSQQNKNKLERYQTKLVELDELTNSIKSVGSLVSEIESYTSSANLRIKKLNNEFKASGIDIPLLNSTNTVEYLKEKLIPSLQQKVNEIEREKQTTQDEFKDYKGDLSSLLSNVSNYQNQLSELERELKTIEDEVEGGGRCRPLILV